MPCGFRTAVPPREIVVYKMATDQQHTGVIARLLKHPHFCDLTNWRIDLLVCCIVAALFTPAASDPNRIYFIALPLFAAWMSIRFAIYRRHLRSRPSCLATQQQTRRPYE